MDKKLLEVRNKAKKKKPAFIRQDAYKRKKLSDKWRSPRGLHSKLRYNKKGNSKKVSPGFKSPVAVKGLSRNGYVMNIITNASQLLSLNKSEDAVIIGATVGTRKRLQLLDKIKELGLHVLHIKNVDEYQQKLKLGFQSRLDSNKKKLHEKEEKKKEEEKKAKEAEKSKEKSIDNVAEKSVEEKKEEENKEKEKVLTQPNQ